MPNAMDAVQGPVGWVLVIPGVIGAVFLTIARGWQMADGCHDVMHTV